MTQEEYIQRLKDAPFHDEKIEGLLDLVNGDECYIQLMIQCGEEINQGLSEGDNLWEDVRWVRNTLSEKYNDVLVLLMFVASSNETWYTFLAHMFLTKTKITEKNGITYIDLTE
jgi:hypothetical protein